MDFILMLTLLLIILDGAKPQKEELENLREDQHLCLMDMKKKYHTYTKTWISWNSIKFDEFKIKFD